MEFILNLNTEILLPFDSGPVANAAAILERDMSSCLTKTDGPSNLLRLTHRQGMDEESYEITVTDSSHMDLYAGDDLGFIYGLLSVSERLLGVKPFWFWMDQELKSFPFVPIPVGNCWKSPKPTVRFRGWFLNDEVLLMHWDNGKPKEFPWQMALEALLRCGGNMVIPGTDKASRENAALASGYGLWLTHHHAEPLGAEIFARAFPDLAPSWAQNPECFKNLWEEAVLRQKNMKVVWTLGFRGQGDCPFWESPGEESFKTPQMRGRLISDLIELQRQIVLRHVKNPVFCTNLYGEVMELYNQGFITLHPDIIKIWADNGYGHMCTRRQDNHDARVPSLPRETDSGPHGVYYHVSFHDLQAAGHMTTLPNPINLVDEELELAWRLGVRDYWIINASNIRPHVYYLDAIRKLWYGGQVSDRSHSREFSGEYYQASPAAADCLENYACSLLQYGPFKDQHAGEQFYNYCVRLLARQFIRDRTKPAKELFWLTEEKPLMEQTACILKIHEKGMAPIEAYYQRCLRASASLSGHVRRLFDATILLQASIHRFCCLGALLFCHSLMEFDAKNMQNSFYLSGSAAECFTAADQAMGQAEYGIWKGFYANDCLTDIRFTAYMIQSVMRIIRVIGDDARLADWYEDFVRPRADRKVRLLAITDHHMTDDALFEAMKRSGKFS